MFVALYGVGYWFASMDAVRYWPFVLIGRREGARSSRCGGSDQLG
jgi:hypothetical protein